MRVKAAKELVSSSKRTELDEKLVIFLFRMQTAHLSDQRDSRGYRAQWVLLRGLD